MVSIFFFTKSYQIQHNVAKYCRTGKATDDNMAIRSSCWIPQATNPHSQYVILIVYCDIGRTNTPHCYIMRTLPLLLNFKFKIGKGNLNLTFFFTQKALLKIISCFRVQCRLIHIFSNFINSNLLLLNHSSILRKVRGQLSSPALILINLTPIPLWNFCSTLSQSTDLQM